ncbi:MAG: FAD:protein FMN transferase [Flavobacteriaceae bacterium]
MINEAQRPLFKRCNKIYFVALLLCCFRPLLAQELVEVHRGLVLMGSDFDITVVHENKALADKAIDTAIDEISRIETLISSWSPDSETSHINRMAGIAPVKVSDELFGLIQRSIRISSLTQNAFDITYAAMDGLWRFDKKMTEVPSADRIQKRLAIVGIRQVELNPQTKEVFLPKVGMKIGFGAIGKGYAADRAKALLQSQGVPAGIINASGDLCVWGKNINGESWTIALTHPLNPKDVLGVFDLENQAVVTSGNYEKYHWIDGERYSHIIDPRTGYPSKGTISVTVFAPKAELADAMATAIFVLGPDIGVDLVNQIPQLEVLIVNEKGVIFTSKNIAIEGDH